MSEASFAKASRLTNGTCKQKGRRRAERGATARGRVEREAASERRRPSWKLTKEEAAVS